MTMSANNLIPTRGDLIGVLNSGSPPHEIAVAIRAMMLALVAEARADIADANQAAGLPRDATLWLLLETVKHHVFTDDEVTMLLAAIAVAQGDNEWPDDSDDLAALRSAERKLSALLVREQPDGDFRTDAEQAAFEADTR